MKRGYLIVLGACACVAGLTLIAFPNLSANAEPPRKGCVAVFKQEYDSAKRQMLLQAPFSSYVTTGPLVRRYYWYCHS
jgi:hypothetical protein